MRVPLRDQSCADRCASWLEPKRPVPCEATGAAVGFLDLLGQLSLVHSVVWTSSPNLRSPVLAASSGCCEFARSCSSRS